MYSPLAQGRAAGAQLLVRTAGDPYDFLRPVRAAVFAVLPDVPLRNVTTMDEMFSRRMAQRRLILPDPSAFHDVRTLECLIEIDAGQAPLRIGQRVRVALSNP